MDHVILIYIVKIRPFLAHLYKSTKTYCCHFDVGIGTGVTLYSFILKFFMLWTKDCQVSYPLRKQVLLLLAL